jgi:hypothetical protein
MRRQLLPASTGWYFLDAADIYKIETHCQRRCPRPIAASAITIVVSRGSIVRCCVGWMFLSKEVGMQRREFLATVLGAAGAAATAPAVTRAAHHEQGGGHGDGRQYYELRRYRLKSQADRKLVHQYWEGAAVGAYNQLGVDPVGVFEPVADSDDAGQLVYVLLPYRSLDHMMAVRGKLPGVLDAKSAAGDYLNAPKDDPAYDRIESKLMVAFAGQPQLHRPDRSKQGKDRLIELRTYESHNEQKARLKVEMFNKHEIKLFQDLGFPNAVFHGDTIIGDKLPSLTYMLMFESREQRDELWDKFFKSDGWAELSSMPRYKNTVSKVHNWFLKPTAYSQL